MAVEGPEATTGLRDRDAIVARARQLAPWHFDIELFPGVRTASLNEPGYADPDLAGVRTIDPAKMAKVIGAYYPDGLAGKTLLDVACNAGGYCFLARSLGAARALGVEARQHWVDQAEFIRSVKFAGSAQIEFVRQDIQQYVKESRESFDLTIFKGIFYHLPDPIGVLGRLCDMTREVIVVDTDSSFAIPESCLTSIQESRTHVMSGLDGLAWLPGGPAAIVPILRWKGFTSTEVVYWRPVPAPPADRGRFCLVGSRFPPMAGKAKQRQ